MHTKRAETARTLRLRCTTSLRLATSVTITKNSRYSSHFSTSPLRLSPTSVLTATDRVQAAINPKPANRRGRREGLSHSVSERVFGSRRATSQLRNRPPNVTSTAAFENGNKKNSAYRLP